MTKTGRVDIQKCDESSREQAVKDLAARERVNNSVPEKDSLAERYEATRPSSKNARGKRRPQAAREL